MRKSFLLPLLCLLLLGGCATETKVVDNTFYSSYPKLEVTVAPEFQYMGEKETKTDSEAHGGGYYLTIFSDAFMFIDPVSERLVAISIIKAPRDAYWLAPSMAFEPIKRKLDYGKCKLGRHTYDYCIFWENGSIVKMHLRNASGDAYRVMLYYHEPKSNYENLTSDQEILEAFNKKSQAAFTVTGARHKPVEKEKQQVASIPKADFVPKMPLRTESKKLIEKDIKKMFARYDFYDDNLNWRGSFANDFVDNGDGTITDKATGLMWQKSGSSRAKGWKRAQTYVKRLNRAQFAGYSDWRWPTIEELASLMEREKVNGVHIDPVFDSKQKTCWSADSNLIGGEGRTGSEVWIGNFAQGAMQIRPWSKSQNLITLYPQFDASFYIRAVRSVK
jgi:hypothetical protein